jgi:hypothetical protein
MDTPEDARLAETLASLTENTSDPVLLSTQISAAKTSLDRLLTDIGSPVEGNLIPVRTNILTRTQAPRSAAEGPQDRASVTRYAEGGDDVQPMGFGAGTPKTPQQAVRFETPGSPEYEAAVAKGLDMSQAGRMGRAKEMGFDTDTAVYRGLTRPYDADTLVPGRFQFLAHDPNVASGYARNFADREGANVVKAFLRKPNPLMVDAGGANWDRIDTRNLPEELRAILDPRATIAAIATAARSRGYGHVTVRNVVDLADGGVGSPTTVEVVWDPSNIRSVNAAFDPEKSGSSTLLAAAPLAAVGGAGLTLAGEDARNQRTVGKPKTSQSARTVGKAKTN